MRFKLLLNRTLRTIDIVAVQPSVSHPFSAIALCSALDYPAPNAGSCATAYNNLVTAGLPSGYNVVTGTRPFSGWALIGPNGPIDFRISRVTHRVAAGAYSLLLSNPMDIMNSSIMTSAFSSTTTFTPTTSLFRDLDLTAGSVYDDTSGAPGQIVSPEQQSFVGIDGSYNYAPGVVTTSRLIRNNPGIGGILSSTVEMLAPTPSPGTNNRLQWAGRFLGKPTPMLSYAAVQASMLGQDYFTTASVSSEWEVEVDDNLISQIASQTGKIYAMTCNRIPDLRIQNQIDAANSIYFGVDASSYLPNIGFTPVMTIDITTLAGTMNTIGTDSLINGTLTDFSGVPLVATFDTNLTLGCAVNAGAWDIILP